MKKLTLILLVLVLALSSLFAKSFVDDKDGYLSKDDILNLETYFNQIETYTGTSVAVHTFAGVADEAQNDAYTDAYAEEAFADTEDYAILYIYTLGGDDIKYCTIFGGELSYNYGDDAPDFYFSVLDELDDEDYMEQCAVFGDCVVALYEYIDQTASGYVVDEARLLSTEEYAQLNENLANYSDELGYPIMVATVTRVKGLNTIDDSDLLLEDYVGIDGDGVMLYINMGDRIWNITTSGLAIQELNDRALERLEGVFLSDLSNGNYLKAFDSFGASARTYALNARNGIETADDEEATDFAFLVFGGLIIGLIVAGITTGIMKSKLKSAVMIDNANQFVKDGSFVLTGQSDIFLYKNVTRTKIERSSSGSSTHHSSSGGSHGGRSGHF